MQPTDSTTVRGDHADILRTTDQRVRTLADLIRVCDIDTQEWEVEHWTANKYEMAAKDAKGEMVVKALFQIKAKLKRKVAVMDARAEIAAMLADARVQIKPQRSAAIVKGVGERHYMMEPSILDLHVGKLSWDEETGHGNYDTSIATSLFKDALEVLIERTKSFQFERVVFPLGHDFFNSDSLSNATTKGTVQDVDSRFQKTFRAGRQLATYAVDRLREVAPRVDVIVVPGNHDQLSAWFLGEVLATQYARTQGVSVDNTPRLRKYVEHYRNMLMMTHGDRGKRQDYALLIATEEPAMFGRTRNREIHTGHLHQTRVQEHHGVRVRISPALTAADAWHAEQTYVGNARAAENFVWHREEGIVTIANYTVPHLEGQRRARSS